MLGELIPWGRDTNPYPMNGWTLKCDTGQRPLTHVKWLSNIPNLACGTPGQVPDTWIGSGVQIPAGTQWFSEGAAYNGSPRMPLTRQWTRPQFQPAVPYRGPKPVPQTRPDPGIPPWLDPLSQPLPSPIPIPVPPPWPLIPQRRPNPQRDPNEQPGGGQPSRSPRPNQKPRYRGAYQPSLTTESNPAGQPRPMGRPRPRLHTRRKPGRREKERKMSMTPKGARALMGFIGLVTEAIDWIDIAFNSLPPSVQRGHWYDTPQEKLALILNNLDKIRPGTFLATWFSETAEDKAFGKLGQVSKHAQQSQFNQGYGESRPGSSPYANARVEGVVDEYMQMFDDFIEEHIAPVIEGL